MEKVLFDCDNTMGLAEKDVDDGITLLYLLGRNDVDLVGITSTFGNGSVKEVNKVITRMREELNIKDVPFAKGAGDAGDFNTAAAEFLVEEAKKNKGEVTLLATGALTNLKAACQLDPQFFSYLKEIKVMGGITEKLSFGEKEIGELNFSCDPEAAKLVLEAPVPVMVATGNMCLNAFFNSDDWQWLQNQEEESYQYIAKHIEQWYYYGQQLVGEVGFHLWDLVPAVHITHPDLYTKQYYQLHSDVEYLTTGQLKLEKVANKKDKIKEPGIINIPTEIKDLDQFKELIFTAWSAIK
ncbi:inosine-uridine nucleoside N-ribohydrolase [Halanaerobacter jeridensis]|uniref:Inosine-uridine nucleoside N-ribohydrolase n=1 Tax=Halanaerobacter jeridensis TaxID=706427 RepID=A0A939BRV0_9FIRM|nr:inosine-uridine nucleoside N-ribohydrolase [Halanaerobacter jeridensis]